ncbi:MAG TPA: hypothetical protein P5274_02030, partial [Candidatus Paceibacterota bacterium]|nr:hypothetical protein [Candidatus Paceibacterota bacterium]
EGEPTEGEPAEGEITEGEGEPPIEGEGECEPLTLTVILPLDGATVTSGGSIFAQCSVTGPNEIEVTLVSQEGDVYRRTVTPPAVVNTQFGANLVGPGAVTYQARDKVTREEKTQVRSVTVIAP